VTRQGAVDDVDLRRDRSLVELAQGGDVDAFGELYDRYFRRLERFCVKRLGDPTEAEEVAQEAFTRAWRALPAFGGERRFYPWMTVIASRICVDTVRRQSRLDVGTVSDTPVIEPGFARLEAEGDLATLQAALGRISHRHREVLELRESHGWSYQHIADHYQVSVGTVEGLLWRARHALRREFLGLCGAVAAFPVIRRFTVGSGNAPTGALAALGSVGAVVALAIGAGPPPAAPTVSLLMAADVAPALPAPARAVTVTPRYAGAAPSAAPATRPAAASAPPAAPPASAPSRAASQHLTTLVPHAQLMSPAAAATAARQKPIVIELGPEGPVIGIDPGVPIPLTHVALGGAK